MGYSIIGRGVPAPLVLTLGNTVACNSKRVVGVGSELCLSTRHVEGASRMWRIRCLPP
jgi:hypothetical protein